jgi:hypothetical protein
LDLLLLVVCAQRSKMKRLKGKYDEQSDDEKELVAKLLGSSTQVSASAAGGSSSRPESAKAAPVQVKQPILASYIWQKG